MTTHKVGIIMNGVTGRMGTNQHLLRSIKAIIDQGGIKLGDAERIMPDPILTGRNQAKLKECVAKSGLDLPVSTDLDAVLANPDYPIFFDASLTQLRGGFVERAVAAGKAIYCEKPTATNLAEALRLAEEMEKLRLADWTTVNGFTTSATTVTLDPAFTANPFVGNRFTLSRTVLGQSGSLTAAHRPLWMMPMNDTICSMMLSWSSTNTVAGACC